MSEFKENVKKSDPKDEKKRLIRRAAYQCFRETGYHETTMAVICKQAGISKGSFYWHYQSKQEVFIDILEAWAREVMGEMFTQFEKPLERKDFIAAISAALQREAQRGRAIVPLWLEFTMLARRDESIQKAIARFYRRARAAISEMLLPHTRHLLSEKQLESIASVIFGAYTGLMMQDLVDPAQASADVAFERFMEAFEQLMY